MDAPSSTSLDPGRRLDFRAPVSVRAVSPDFGAGGLCHRGPGEYVLPPPRWEGLTTGGAELVAASTVLWSAMARGTTARSGSVLDTLRRLGAGVWIAPQMSVTRSMHCPVPSPLPSLLLLLLLLLLCLLLLLHCVLKLFDGWRLQVLLPPKLC